MPEVAPSEDNPADVWLPAAAFVLLMAVTVSAARRGRDFSGAELNGSSIQFMEQAQ